MNAAATLTDSDGGNGKGKSVIIIIIIHILSLVSTLEFRCNHRRRTVCSCNTKNTGTRLGQSKQNVMVAREEEKERMKRNKLRISEGFSI